MKKGYLSFAIATFVLLVLFYFVAIAFTLEDYQQAGQKRLEAQLLSQRYQDAVVFFNDTVADAIEDAAFNSKYAKACNPAAADYLSDSLGKRLVEYLNNASSRLSTESVIVSFNWNDTAKAWAKTSTESPVQKVMVLQNTPPCGNATNAIEMNRISTEISFLVNVTSRDGTSGYFNRPFSYYYDVLMNSSDETAEPEEYYIRISRELQPDSYYRCIRVTGC